MINPVHLRTLQAVLDTGSFATAGRALGYTASAVSQQMHTLERATGLLLFERGAQGIRATAAAELLAERMRGTLAALEELESDVRRLATGEEGRLYLGAFTTASTCIVPPALANLTMYCPTANVQLTEGEPEELLNPLLAGDLDILLVYEYDLVPRRWPEEVDQLEIFREELVLMVPTSHPIVDAPRVCLDELADEAWIGGREGSAGTVALERLCAANGFAPRIVFRSDNYGVVRALVRAGLGMALVPSLGHLPAPNIKSASLDRETSYRKILALHRRGNTNALLPQALRALAEAARDEGLRCSAPRGWCVPSGALHNDLLR